MKIKPLLNWIRVSLVAGFFLTQSGVCFPPAPDHVVLGMVRNEFGEPIQQEGASVILTSDSRSIRTSIAPGIAPGANYRLKVPLDSGVTLDPYKATALLPLVPFRMSVEIDGATYLPIEMTGTLRQLGSPTGETRLDLTLGEDLDGDGLPDAWERSLLKEGQDLADILPESDSDNDGISNLNEYLAGTYAFDPKDGFRLDLVGMVEGRPQLEFTAIRGRTYVLQRSVDLKVWVNVPFRIVGQGSDDVLRDFYQATDVRQIRVEIDSSSDSGKGDFFKLALE